MKTYLQSLYCILAIIFLKSSILEGASLDLLAERYWSGVNESDYREIFKEMEDLPKEDYIPFLVIISQSPHFKENENSAHISMEIVRWYKQKEDHNKVVSNIFLLLKSNKSSFILKRNILREVLSWYEGSTTMATDGFSDFDYDNQRELWISGQYAISMVVSDHYYKNVKERQQLKHVAEECLEKSIKKLVVAYVDGQKMDWVGKTLGSYRRVLGSKFDQMFIPEIRLDTGPRSRRLSLLGKLCGWGERSEIVGDYLKEIKSELENVKIKDKEIKDDLALVEKLSRLQKEPIN